MFSELLTTCDYHSVGLRAVAYTELSVKVAKMSNVYAEKLVEHLLEHKISHWDNSVRELTGQALRKLAPITKGKFIKKLLKCSFLENSILTGLTFNIVNVIHQSLNNFCKNLPNCHFPKIPSRSGLLKL